MSDLPMRLSLAALGGGTGGFLRDARFGRMNARPLHHAAAEADADPVGRAFADGYAQGAEDARTAALVEAAEANAARDRIETALANMDAALVQQFEERLRQTVMALCEAVVAPAAIDPDALAHRVKAAAALFARAGDERVIRLHPEDLALVHARLPEDWHCEPDSSLERGSIRVEGPQGGVEDGPAQWRAALEDALRQC
ncbi:MAG: hypothetical protein RIS94_892 [Pseudomonadota bacterium]|jgi:flagellar assembly protein FliH